MSQLIFFVLLCVQMTQIYLFILFFSCHNALHLKIISNSYNIILSLYSVSDDNYLKATCTKTRLSEFLYTTLSKREFVINEVCCLYN